MGNQLLKGLTKVPLDKSGIKPLHQFPAIKKKERGQARQLKVTAQGKIFIGIDPEDLQPLGQRLLQLIQEGINEAAEATPRGPKVNNHRHRGTANLPLECFDIKLLNALHVVISFCLGIIVAVSGSFAARICRDTALFTRMAHAQKRESHDSRGLPLLDASDLAEKGCTNAVGSKIAQTINWRFQ